MGGMLIIVCLLSGFVGLKKPVVGAVVGGIGALVYVSLVSNAGVAYRLVFGVFGCVASGVGGYGIPWFLSGFKGGVHNTGPSYIGGMGRGWRPHKGGGIMLSDEEREHIQQQERSESLYRD